MPNQVWLAPYLSKDTLIWPSDIGDDPSFKKHREFRHQGGNLTWGVCRPDVRSKIQQGDLVCYFAVRTLQDGRIGYHFSAFATVESRVSHFDIWSPHPNHLQIYQHYSNVLVKLDNQKMIHWEPSLVESQWHSNWLQRISSRKREHKECLMRSQTSNLASEVVQKLSNSSYIIFSNSSTRTRILETPPLVAIAEDACQTSEVWVDSEFPKALHKLLFASRERQCLRLPQRLNRHRHIRFAPENGVDQIRKHLIDICDRHGFQHRI